MTNEQREIHRKKRVIEYAEEDGESTAEKQCSEVEQGASILHDAPARHESDSGLRVLRIIRGSAQSVQHRGRSKPA